MGMVYRAVDRELQEVVAIETLKPEALVAPHALHGDIPLAISVLVMRAMARDREARPATAKALHDALEQLG
jgi:hypothetical protein